jgi:pimeloyl-ACP methyl ester carboxylesterase
VRSRQEQNRRCRCWVTQSHTLNGPAATSEETVSEGRLENSRSFRCWCGGRNPAVHQSAATPGQTSRTLTRKVQFVNATIPSTHTVLVDGLTIRYADSGAIEGPVILLTSPWPESLFAFRRVWPLLAPTGRLVAVDLPGFGHSDGRAEVLNPSAMADFLGHFITELDLGTPHVVAPDVGASAALFLAARHPSAVRSLVVGGGGAAVPLDVTGALADIIAAPGIEVFQGPDIRGTVGVTVEPAAPHDGEPDVWEDYVSGYDNGRFAESTRYVRSYPEQLPALRDLLPSISVPVHVFASAVDPLVPVSNGRYLNERIPGSEFTVLPASHFAWEEIPVQFAAIVTNLVTRVEAASAQSS